MEENKPLETIKETIKVLKEINNSLYENSDGNPAIWRVNDEVSDLIKILELAIS